MVYLCFNLNILLSNKYKSHTDFKRKGDHNMVLGKILSLLGIAFFVVFFVFLPQVTAAYSDTLRNGLLFAVNGSILLVGGLILSKLSK